MEDIYDESGILIGWRHTLEEAVCKICRMSIYSEKCPHTDPELIELIPKKVQE